MELPVVLTQISIDKDNIYAAGFSSGIGESMTGVFSYDKNGKQIWQTYFKIKVISPIQLGDKFLIFTGSTFEGGGLFVVKKNDGSLIKSNSLSNEVPLYLIPAISDNRDINFFGAEQLFHFRFSETPLDKLLPY